MNSPWIRPSMPSKATIVAWSQVLKLFRYYRHYGGHSSIEDEFVLAVKPDALQSKAIDKLKTLASSFGQSLDVYNFDDRTVIGISDKNACAVNTTSVEAAVALEAILVPFADAIIEPPIDSPHCFSPKNHPELWEHDA